MMPVSLCSCSLETLRELAGDLGLTFASLKKDELVVALCTLFKERGYDERDISTMHKQEPKLIQASYEQRVPVTVPLSLPPPGPFGTQQHSRRARWESFINQFNVYVSATGLIDDQQKKAVLLHCAGGDLQRIVETLYVDPSATCGQLVDAVSKYFAPVNTTRIERYKLYELNQRPNEGISDFVTRLRHQARACGFNCPNCAQSLEDDHIIDVLLRNTTNESFRRRLFEKGLKKLEEVLLLANSMEYSSEHSNQISGRPSALNYTTPKDEAEPTIQYSRTNGITPSATVTVDKMPNSHQKCKFCGLKHEMKKSKCPAVGKACLSCGQLNHFSACCQAPKVQQVQPSTLNEDRYLYHVFGNRQAHCSVLVCGQPRTFLIDSGASDNFIPEEFVPPSCAMRPAPIVTCYGGSTLKPLGKVALPVSRDRFALPNLIDFLVVTEGMPLLGLSTSLDLGYIQLNSAVFSVQEENKASDELHNHVDLPTVLSRFRELFNSELGSVNGVTAKIQLKPGSMPQFRRHRSVPLALRDKVEAALDAMVQRGTLVPIRTSSWASPMVTVAKPDGTVRLCADYTQTLAGSIDVEAYPLPHPEDLFASLAGNKIFTKLDLRTCFEQFRLDEAAKEILTVNTIKGLMRYERLPYGIASAPAIVQRAMEEILGNLKVCIFLDDILIASKDLSSHLSTLSTVLHRLQKAGIRLRRDKCSFCQPSLKYLGYIVSSEGRSSDPDKVNAIVNCPAPTDISSLRSFLGLVRFYDKFIPDLSSKAASLYNLLKKEVDWQWNASEKQAFQNIKSILSSSQTLVHYDPNIQIVLSCDASPLGVGAILGHRYSDGSERPISYASRSLSSAESNYAQIDKEALSIMFGVNKFEKFLFGRRFILVTDHKPLQAIFGFNKGLPACATARLQRYAVRLAVYNFTVEYRTGAKNSNADALSRAPCYVSPTKEDDEAQLFMLSCVQSLAINQETIARETLQDEILLKVLARVKEGWPKDCSPEFQITPFWNRRNELSVIGNILMWGRRVVLPPSLQGLMLDELHSTHQGQVKMKALARLNVWWPKIDEHIESVVNDCTSCQQTAPCSPSISNEPWPPVKPWERIHLDYCHIDGRDLLVLIDSGSKWIEADFMKSTTSESTLRKLFQWFSRFGFPASIHTDGGPQFTSFEFRDKMRHWNIKHSVSPPYHPQSNGLAERAVRLVKESFKKNSPSLSKLEAILFRYRATPLTSHLKSPAELLLGYRLKSRLSIKPNVPSRNSPPANTPYKRDDIIWVRDFRKTKPKWQLAKVKTVLGRTVVIAECAGSNDELRRHVNQTRPKRF